MSTRPTRFRDRAKVTLTDEQSSSRSTLTGNFRKHEAFRSRFLEHDRDVLVYLPPGYDEEPDRRYPVLYLQDGQNLFDGATAFTPGEEWQVDETAEMLIRRREIDPLIIVGIYNSGTHRVAEYTPSRDANQRAGGLGDRYGQMLTEDLKPWIDGTYRTRSGRQDTALGGSSLGGLITLYLGLKLPGVFGKLAILSPSVWWNRRMIVRLVRRAEKSDTRIWLDVGTAEGGNAVEDVRRLRDALLLRGWSLGGDLAYLEAEGATHTESAWALRVGPMLRFLFPVS